RHSFPTRRSSDLVSDVVRILKELIDKRCPGGELVASLLTRGAGRGGGGRFGTERPVHSSLKRTRFRFMYLFAAVDGDQGSYRVAPPRATSLALQRLRVGSRMETRSQSLCRGGSDEMGARDAGIEVHQSQSIRTVLFTHPAERSGQ